MYQTLYQSPLLRILLFFIIGILVQHHSDVSGITVPLAGLGLLLLLTSYPYRQNVKFRWLFGAGICILSFSLACLITRSACMASSWNIVAEKHTYCFYLLDDPVQKPKTRQCKVRITGTEAEIYEQTIGKKAVIYLPIDSVSKQLTTGDYFFAELELKPPESKLENSSFDYGAFLRHQGFAATGFVRAGSWEVKQKAGKPSFDIWKIAMECRRKLLTQLRPLIKNEQSYAVAVALLLGYKDDLDKDLKTSFSSVGVSHVLSVSGMHVGMLYGLLSILLPFLGSDKRIRVGGQLIILLAMWMFAFLTGLSPSVVRSVIMLSFFGFARIFSKTSFTLNAVVLSAFFMLIYKPLYLFDLGFQLSYIAVASIISIHPLLLGLLKPKHPVVRYTWELSSVSTAAQLGTFPLTIYYFHQFPVLFLPANLFVIPLTGILMILIPLSFILQLAFAPNSWVFFPLNYLLDLYITGVESLEKIPFNVLNNLILSQLNVCLFYAVLACGMLLAIKKRIVYLYLILLLVIFQGISYL